jgi:hypothetical protein
VTGLHDKSFLLTVRNKLFVTYNSQQGKPVIYIVPLFGIAFMTGYFMIYWALRDVPSFAPVPNIYVGEIGVYLDVCTFIIREPAFNYCNYLDRKERKLICEELAAWPLSLRSLSY